jgi:YD repeat-containing protein
LIRLSQRLDHKTGASQGETVTYTYDANDRLLQEVSSTGTTTTYGYNSTQQTSKAVTAADGSRVITTFTYDLQGRLEVGTIETWSASNVLLRREKTTYDYDHTGIRVSALHEVDSNGDGAWDQRIQTDYLNDPENHTGYSQVLRETYSDAVTGAVQKRIDYTIGLDEIAQTTTTYDAAGAVVSRETLIFGHDGHGSVRLLFDLAGALVQLYVYEAYGQLAAIYNAAGQFVSANPTDARTSLL